MLKTLLIVPIFVCIFISLGIAQSKEHTSESISLNLSYKKSEKSKDSNNIYKKFILENNELRFEYKYAGKRMQNDKIGKVNVNQKDLGSIKDILERHQLYKDYNHNSLERKMMSYQLTMMLLVETPEHQQSKQYTIQIEGGEKLIDNTVFNELEVLIERLDKIVARNK